MKLAIVGFGVEGKSALAYWSKLGADITVCDQNADIEVPKGVERQLGAGYLQNLHGFDVIFRSAGVKPDVILAENPEVNDKITSTINGFLRVCPTKNIIGVTGTKGKGTTSTLIAKMLEAAGKKVLLGGNIGVPPFDFLSELTPDSWVVLELSSFQLSDLKYSPHIGVCLMIVPEHLNWHAGMDEYTEAKSRLFKNQIENDIAIYFSYNELSERIASAGAGEKIPYFAAPGAEVINGNISIAGNALCATDELKLLGEHNWQNACAAVTAVWQVTQDTTAVRSVLTTFDGLEHRLEFVREVHGVKYYNDSYGTTPETAIVALQAFIEPKIIILGGSDKGARFDELAKTVAEDNVRQAILIGDTASQIEQALRAAGFTAVVPGGTTMPEIVAAAKNVARTGDVVLLSTACASFGLFASYTDRGNQFKQSLLSLS